MTQTIYTKKGDSILVDDENYEFLNQWPWYIGNHGYAIRSITLNGKKIAILMHRLLMHAPPAFEVDHVNQNRRDNRRHNLRLATRSQNQQNKPGFPGTSQYKGVRKHPKRKRWDVRIKMHGVQHTIGAFDTEIEAARAYDAAAIAMHGTFAYLNFPQDAQGGQRV